MRTKLLVALLAMGANAKFCVHVSGGAGVAYRKLKMESKGLFNQQVGTLPTNVAHQTGDVAIAAGSDEVKLADSLSKRVIPGELHGAVAGFWKTDAAFMFGLGLQAGYRHHFHRPANDLYTGALQNGLPPVALVSVKHPTGVFFARPRVLAAWDVSDITVCLSAGVEFSYQEWGLQYGNILAESSSWIGGVCGGIEGIYKIGSCFGVGFGVTLTYYPDSFAKFKQKGAARKINAQVAEDAELLNAGGTWALTAHIAGHYALNAA